MVNHTVAFSLEFSGMSCDHSALVKVLLFRKGSVRLVPELYAFQ